MTNQSSMICVSTNTHAAWKLHMQMSAHYVCTPLENKIFFCIPPPWENFCRRPCHPPTNISMYPLTHIPTHIITHQPTYNLAHIPKHPHTDILKLKHSSTYKYPTCPYTHLRYTQPHPTFGKIKICKTRLDVQLNRKLRQIDRRTDKPKQVTPLLIWKQLKLHLGSLSERPFCF